VVPSRTRALRGRPELLAIPFIAIWAIINIPAWSWFGDRSIVETVAGWTEDLFASRSTPIYPLTILLACASFLFASVLLQRRFKLSWGRSILVGSTFPFSFVSFFEALWQNTGLIARPGLFNTPPVGEVLILSWVLVGSSSLPFWKLTRNGLLTLGSLVFVWIVWVAVGYPQWFEGSVLGLSLNLLLKFQFFLLFVVLLLAGEP
jgi:hypothetical protein